MISSLGSADTSSWSQLPCATAGVTKTLLPFGLHDHYGTVKTALPTCAKATVVIVRSLVSVKLLFSSMIESVSVLLPVPVLSPVTQTVFTSMYMNRGGAV